MDINECKHYITTAHKTANTETTAPIITALDKPEVVGCGSIAGVEVGEVTTDWQMMVQNIIKT